ncbi:MAG: hypothetical protein VB009_07820 [Erysipelotrichaceae bacterium]|nr:hypothetical protein [Erysipelotrichaceae bacterium]
MKKLTCIIVLLLVSFQSVMANSTPTYWQGDNLGEVLIMDENVDIAVINENIIFDFTDKTISTGSYWLTGKVDVVYQMHNSTSQATTVEMVFPFIDSIDHFKSELLSVAFDQELIDFKLLIDQNEYDESKSYDDLSGLKRNLDEYWLDINDNAVLYQIDLKVDQNSYFVIDLNYLDDSSKVMGFGQISGYQYVNQNNHLLSGWVYDDQTLYLLVLNGDIDIKINGYSDYQATNKIELDHVTSKTDVSLKDHLLNFIRSKLDENISQSFDDVQLLNLLAGYLSHTTDKYMQDYDLTSLFYQKRLFFLNYEVTFNSEQTHELAISYLINGTMDKSETVAPTHSFTYLLSPAKNWAGFNDLTIDIYTSNESPYIIKSSLAFDKMSANHYQYKSALLPNDELSFTLYQNEKISLGDRVMYRLNRWSYGLYFLAPFVVFGFIVGLIIFLVKKRQR